MKLLALLPLAAVAAAAACGSVKECPAGTRCDLSKCPPFMPTKFCQNACVSLTTRSPPKKTPPPVKEEPEEPEEPEYPEYPEDPEFPPGNEYPPCGGFRITPPLECPDPDSICMSDPRLGGCGLACDAPGICVVPLFCGGFAGFGCPDGLECWDDPRDDCDPFNGGADCGGICI